MRLGHSGPISRRDRVSRHAIEWDKFLPRFGLFKAQEQASRVAHGL